MSELCNQKKERKKVRLFTGMHSNDEIEKDEVDNDDDTCPAYCSRFNCEQFRS